MSRTRRVIDAAVKATALARIAAGETITSVADDIGLPRTHVSNWLRQARDRGLIGNAQPRALVAPPIAADQLRDDVAAVLHQGLVTLQRHAEFYASDEWLQGADKAAIVESTRVIGGRIVSIMDRLGGRVAPGSDRTD